MKRKWPAIPFFVLLLPVFFVLHGYVENAPFVNAGDCGRLLLQYLLVSTCLFGLLYMFYRDPGRTGLALGGLQSIYFFFGALHDGLSRHAPVLSRYAILLPLTGLALVFFLVFLKRTGRSFSRPIVFLNVLFLVYLLVDSRQFFFGLKRSPTGTLSVDAPFTGTNVLPCDSCAAPDIYFLLFDEYTSTDGLRQWYGYDNSGLDSFLVNGGFHIQRKSRSNYNFTSFSMASMLNMSYLKGLPANDTCSITDYAACNALIRDNAVVQFLSSRQYEIVNASIFDLAGMPAPVGMPLLPQGTNLITSQTLFSRIGRDIGWNIYSLPFQFQWMRTMAYTILDNNQRLIGTVKAACRTRGLHPRFVYAHLEMPHNPFFYDKDQRLRTPKQLGAGDMIRGYLDYIPYTNLVLQDLVTTIRQNTNDQAVIILMGDHGLRSEIPDPQAIHLFQNQNAIYFPDRDYRLLYDSISGVNQFRVIFNHLFHQRIPGLEDRTIPLKDPR